MGSNCAGVAVEETPGSHVAREPGRGLGERRGVGFVLRGRSCAEHCGTFWHIWERRGFVLPPFAVRGTLWNILEDLGAPWVRSARRGVGSWGGCDRMARGAGGEAAGWMNARRPEGRATEGWSGFEGRMLGLLRSRGWCAVWDHFAHEIFGDGGFLGGNGGIIFWILELGGYGEVPECAVGERLRGRWDWGRRKIEISTIDHSTIEGDGGLAARHSLGLGGVSDRGRCLGIARRRELRFLRVSSLKSLAGSLARIAQRSCCKPRYIPPQPMTSTRLIISSNSSLVEIRPDHSSVGLSPSTRTTAGHGRRLANRTGCLP